MNAFQRYCKIHKTKMLYFTSFVGFMCFITLVFSPTFILKHGPMVLVEDSLAQQLVFDLPITFIFLLFIQRIFSYYISGQFFTKASLSTVQQLARVCLMFGLIVKPGILIIICHFYAQDLEVASNYLLNYVAMASFPTAVLGYALYLVSGISKIARDIDEEQQFTV